MTQIESLQQNIHFYKMELSRARKFNSNDAIDKINNKRFRKQLINHILP